MSRIRPAVHVLIILLLGGCAGLGGMADFDEPEVELVGLEPLPRQGMEARFLVRLRIINPNAVPLALDGLAYEVFLRDARVLSGVSDQGLKVGAFSETVAELEVAVGMLSSLALVRDLMSTPPDDGIPYRLNAKLSRKGAAGAIRVSREGLLAL